MLAARQSGMTTVVAPLQRDACPDCDGTGEIQIGDPTRDPATGAYDVDSRVCTTCEGSGEIPDWMAVCEADDGPHAFEVEDWPRCSHGPRTLCPAHSIECRVCSAESVL